MNTYQSIEADLLKEIIATLKMEMEKIDPKFKHLILKKQSVIMNLQNVILPIVQERRSLQHSLNCQYLINGVETANKFNCNGMLVYIPLKPDYTESPKIGILNTTQLAGWTPQGVEVSVQSWDILGGYGTKVTPVNIPLNDLMQ